LVDFAKGQELIFLWLMRGGQVYGYELASRLEKLTRGHIRVSYGTVYPFLRRMERKGLLRSTKDEASGRIYYELTPKGKLAVDKLPEKLKESKEYYNEKLLGILAIYSELFGHQALNKLLKQVQSRTTGQNSVGPME